MVQGVCEELQSGPDEVEELEVQPYVMRKGPYHPSDADLLENALGEHDTASGLDIEGHLADCLYCRIRLNLIVDLSAIGRPVAVVSSVSNAVPRETLVAHLGDLDVKSDIREAREAALSRNATALRTGRPITDPADVRNEFLHMLADDLAALDQQADPPYSPELPRCPTPEPSKALIAGRHRTAAPG